MVRVSMAVGLFYSVPGAATTCEADGTCAGADETTLLHINQLQVEGESMNTIGNSNGWFGTGTNDIAKDETAASVRGDRDCGRFWKFLLNNGECNDGSQGGVTPHSSRYIGACMLKTDCLDCGNCGDEAATTQPPTTQPPTTQPPTTQPPATQPPTSHDNHVQGGTHSNSCPAGSSTISFEAECRAAASAVNLGYGGTQDESGRPSNCYVLSENPLQHVVYFNQHASGAPNSNGSPLCAKACNALTDCNGHGTTEDDNKINGCSCACDEGFGGDHCATPVCKAAQRCSGHGTTTEGQDATDGCECTCSDDFHGDDCSEPPACHTGHCNGHSTVDQRTVDQLARGDRTNGCNCVCSNGWSGEHCTTAPAPTTTPTPATGNPQVISCNETYEFVLERGEQYHWKPTVDSPPGSFVELETCGGPAGQDTVIDKPCYNDDADGTCNYKSKCDYIQTEHNRQAEIFFYNHYAGTGSLMVCCNGFCPDGRVPKVPNPTVIECGQQYPFELKSGESWTPTLHALEGQTTTLSTCEAPGGLDTMIQNPCSSDDDCGVMSECSHTISQVQTEVSIKFWSTVEGQSTLTVSCSGGPNVCDATLDCNGHGTTVDEDRTVDGCTCECDGVFSGDDCGTAPACVAALDCFGHGTTADLDSTNGCNCTCLDGFHGDSCSVPPACHTGHCNGHSILDKRTVDQLARGDRTNGCECHCDRGFSGENCMIPPECDAAVDCSGHGMTDDKDKTNGCLCMCYVLQGFTGVDCAIPPVCNATVHCGLHGDTTDLDSTNGCDCTCRDGFRGVDCSIPPVCDGVRHCNGHSTLGRNASDGECLCDCANGWTGESCKIPPVDGPTEPPQPTTQPTTQPPTTQPPTQPPTQAPTQAPTQPPVDNGEARAGANCSEDHARQVTPPSLAGGCQRCTCVNGNWQCACSMRHRREINDVTDAEFDLFAKAVNRMKNSGMWVNIAKVHAASEKQNYSTHGDPYTFLPWHRKFFIEVENRLQVAAKETGVTNQDACQVTIPYWNWALEDNFAQSKVFANDRLGALNNHVISDDLDEAFCVNDGRFGKEALHSEFGKARNPFQTQNFMQDGCTTLWSDNACMERIWEHNRGEGSDCIFRKGPNVVGRLPTLTYAQMVTALREHDSYKGIDNYEQMATFIEREIHNNLHGAVGGMTFSNRRRWQNNNYGHMTSMYSPYDPIFFLHHGFIDFLWSQWQDVHVTGQWRDRQLFLENNTVYRGNDYLNNLLFDGNTDVFPVTDVNMAMDIKDDDETTERVESACVKYHEKQTEHACADDWTRIQTCFANLATYEKLHTVPRIKHFTAVGDVCDPLNKLHFDTDRMWLETMVKSGMMQEEHVQTVLDWEKNQLKSIEKTTEVIDIGDGNSTGLSIHATKTHQCDKALCFSATKMLQICDSCEDQGWTMSCHCSLSSQGLTGEGMSCWESRS